MHLTYFATPHASFDTLLTMFFSMYLLMFAISHKCQIFDPVVKFISIDMMDLLIGF